MHLLRRIQQASKAVEEDDVQCGNSEASLNTRLVQPSYCSSPQQIGKPITDTGCCAKARRRDVSATTSIEQVVSVRRKYLLWPSFQGE